MKIDESIRAIQSTKIEQLKKRRNQSVAEEALRSIERAAINGDNLMPHVMHAVENYCTMGEIANTLRKVFGEYH